MVRFIEDYRDVYGVEPICQVLPIASSTYYAHKVRQEAPDSAPERVKRDAELVVDVRRVWEENFRVYGCLLYTSPSPRDLARSRMPSSA